MNTATFDVSMEVARKKYLQYLAACKQNPSADLVLIKRVYRELSLGKRIINANDELVKAGRNADGLPMLAIGRAHEEWVRLEWGEVSRFDSDWRFCGDYSWNRKPSFRWRLPQELRLRDVPRPNYPGQMMRNPKTYRAMVPIIPPNIRPTDALSKYWIMWEAEWKPVPPVDPILLKRIDGPFFVVLGHWDLTDVERSVLGAFRRGE